MCECNDNVACLSFAMQNRPNCQWHNEDDLSKEVAGKTRANLCPQTGRVTPEHKTDKNNCRDKAAWSQAAHEACVTPQTTTTDLGAVQTPFKRGQP